MLSDLGRSPHGERGLKLPQGHSRDVGCRRSPHGERGLKSVPVGVHLELWQSLSSWRAWIEITEQLQTMSNVRGVALLMESVD